MKAHIADGKHIKTKADVDGLLTIGYDAGNGTDMSSLAVARVDGDKMTHLNTFFGAEADWVYFLLTRIKTQPAEPKEQKISFAEEQNGETQNTLDTYNGPRGEGLDDLRDRDSENGA